MARLGYDSVTMKMKPAECGTRSGHNKHLRLKEIPCEPCKAATRAWVAEWASRHPERVKKINKKARDKYRSRPEVQEMRRAKGREYIKSEQGRESFTRSNHARRARKLAAATEKYSVQQVLDLYGALCHICKKEIDTTLPRKVGSLKWKESLHLDHVIPLSKGGSNTLDNVRPSHGICNKTKGAKII